MASRLDELLAAVIAGVNRASARVEAYEARNDARITLPNEVPESEAEVAAANADECPIEYPEPAEGELGVAELNAKKSAEEAEADEAHADDETEEPKAEPQDDTEGEARHDAMSAALEDIDDAMERLSARLGAFESRRDDAAFEAKHPRGPDGKFGSGGGSAALKPDPSKYNSQRAAYIKARIADVEKALKSNNPLEQLKAISAGIKSGHGKTKVWVDAIIAEHEAGFNAPTLENDLADVPSPSDEEAEISHEAEAQIAAEKEAKFKQEGVAKAYNKYVDGGGSYDEMVTELGLYDHAIDPQTGMPASKALIEGNQSAVDLQYDNVADLNQAFEDGVLPLDAYKQKLAAMGYEIHPMGGVAKIERKPGDTQLKKALEENVQEALNEQPWVSFFHDSKKKEIIANLDEKLASGSISQDQYDAAFANLKVSKKLIKEMKSINAGLKPDANVAGLKPDANVVTEIGNWKKVGNQKGSNPGGTYEAPDGSQVYAKTLKSQDHVDSEIAANALYEAMGMATLSPQKATMNGKAAIMSTIADVKKYGIDDPIAKQHAQQQFVAHAFLGNWDAVGASYDNLGWVKGKMTVLDAGGSLKYRAQGQAKSGDDWGDNVKELTTLIDPSVNPNMAKVFGGMTTDQLTKAAMPVLSLSDNQIIDICHSTFTGKNEATKMAETLIARKGSIAKQIAALKSQPSGIAPAAPMPELGKPASQSDMSYANTHLAKPKGQLVKEGFNVHQLHTMAGKAPPPPGYALSDQTKQFAETMQSFWPSSLPKNVEKAKPQFDAIQAAMSLADQAQPSGLTSLAALPKVVGSGATVNAINDYLDKVKKDYGIATDGQIHDTLASAIKAPKTAETIAKLKALPHKTIEHATYLEDAQGNELKAVKKLTTKDIPGDWYAKASAIAAQAAGSKAKSPLDTGEMHAVLEQYTKNHGYGSLAASTQAAVKSYQDGGFVSINKQLRDGKLTPAIKAKVDELDAAMKPLPCDFDTCYRGINADFKTVTGFDDHESAVGRVFEHHAFASVARRESKSKSFAGHSGTMMKMSLPAGVKGCVMPNQEWETEFLLDRNSMFQIDKVEKVEGRTYVHCTYLGKRDGV